MGPTTQRSSKESLSSQILLFCPLSVSGFPLLSGGLVTLRAVEEAVAWRDAPMDT